MTAFFHSMTDALKFARIVCRKLKQTLNNELKFHIVNIINGTKNRHCIPLVLTMSTALTGNFLRSVSE